MSGASPLHSSWRQSSKHSRAAVGGDYFASHDLEDVLSAIDGRPELMEEVRASSDDLRADLAREFSSLIRDRSFIDALPGHLPPDPASQARIPILHERLQALTQRLPASIHEK